MNSSSFWYDLLRTFTIGAVMGLIGLAIYGAGKLLFRFGGRNVSAPPKRDEGGSSAPPRP
jgi:hypothetical protein